MKKIIVIAGILFGIYSLSAQSSDPIQSNDLTQLVGTYEGSLAGLESEEDKRKAMKLRIEIMLPNHFVISSYEEGVWKTQLEETLVQSKNKENKNDNLIFDFNFIESVELDSVKIGLLQAPYKKKLGLEGLCFILVGKDGKEVTLDMKREGGDPKLSDF